MFGRSLINMVEHEIARHKLSQTPVYVFDTSGVIDLCRIDGAAEFFASLSETALIPPVIFGELVQHEFIYLNGQQREIPAKIMDQLCLMHDCGEKLTRDIAAHKMYDSYRYDALWLSSQLCPWKKTTIDPISDNDTHVLSTAMVLGMHGPEFNLGSVVPVVFSSDAHITCPVSMFADMVLPPDEYDLPIDYCCKMVSLQPKKLR